MLKTRNLPKHIWGEAVNCSVYLLKQCTTRNTVTLSICEIKYVAASSGVSHALWLHNLLKSIKHSQEGPTIMHIDNKSAIVFAKNSVYHEKSKHIDTMYYFIREHANNNKVELHYVKSQDQETDIIMKAHAVGVFHNI